MRKRLPKQLIKALIRKHCFHLEIFLKQEKVYNRFIHNTVMFGVKGLGDYRRMLSLSQRALESVVSNSFIWRNTKENREFWSIIAEKAVIFQHKLYK